MSATALLMKLRQAGLSVSRDGDQLIVSPRDRLTDELRAAIRGCKRELLDELERTQLATDLEARIRAMAKRWGFSPNELTEALASAKSDQRGWMAWAERDERDFGGCQTPDDFAIRYRRLRGLV